MIQESRIAEFWGVAGPGVSAVADRLATTFGVLAEDRGEFTDRFSSQAMELLERFSTVAPAAPLALVG